MNTTNHGSGLRIDKPDQLRSDNLLQTVQIDVGRFLGVCPRKEAVARGSRFASDFWLLMCPFPEYDR